MSKSDNVLVREALAGEQDAYTELYNRHYDRVVKSISRYNVEQAHDLAQDAMARAFHKLDSFRGDAKFNTWLHRIALNMVFMARRRHKDRVFVPLNDETQEDSRVLPELASWDKRQLGVVDKLLLAKAMSRMPTLLKEAFILTYVYGYENGESAELLGISKPAFKARNNRARNEIRRIMGVKIKKRPWKRKLKAKGAGAGG